ncbi:MAG: hypothetical protein V4525_11770 [Pseudomonadota bacterium]
MKRKSTSPLAPISCQRSIIQTNIISAAEALYQVMCDLNAERQQTGKRIAIVSGGSVSGYSAALMLVAEGFNVILAEKRMRSTRDNVISLKQEALYMLAKLSPNGSLLRELYAKKLITPHQRAIEDQEGLLRIYDEPTNTLLSWLASTSVQVPKDSDAAQPPQFNNWNPEWSSKTYRKNLAHAQIADLEEGLNHYCVNVPGLRIIRSNIQLLPPTKGSTLFIPEFYFEEAKHSCLRPDFPIDLICIAEGANSQSRKIIGGEWPVVDPNENWWYGNYMGAPDSLGGFQNFTIIPAGNIATLYIEKEEKSLANIGVYFQDSENAENINVKHQAAQKYLLAAGSPLNIHQQNRDFDSGPISILLRRARSPIKGNVVLVGDAAASGSPVGGLGASLAMSAYPAALQRLVRDQRFWLDSTNTESNMPVINYLTDLANIADIFHARAAESMGAVGLYSEKTRQELLHQSACAHAEISLQSGDIIKSSSKHNVHFSQRAEASVGI